MTTDHAILIIEDDDDSREAMGAFLELHGYTVVLASDGAKGLAFLRAGARPCLILLDLVMPGKNGFQFRVEQVLDPDLAAIPVIVYSGDPDAFGNSAMLGTVAQLCKPIDVDKLLEVVKAHC